MRCSHPASWPRGGRRWTAKPPPWLAAAARLALPIHALVIALILALPALTGPFVQSVLFHSLDPAASELVDRAARPWTLKAEVLPLVAQRFRIGVAVYGLLFLAFTLAAGWGAGALRRYCVRGFEAVSGLALFHLVFVSHWGFATGIAVTFRAAVFAYLLAAVLGLTWTGLQRLRSARHTIPVYGATSLLLLAAAAFFWAQPRVEYVMVGSTEARIAIVKGTPQAVADVIRFGEYEGGDGVSLRIRSAPDVATALEQIATVDSVSGAFVPVAANDGRYPVIWQTRFLPERDRNAAMAFSVIGLLLLILTFGGALHGLHPLAVGAEFFVDTIRGIPMLVIILYIGLPLAGAVKDATGGGIDLANFTRGVIAIAIGYSAYMAEIFRSGIEAVPKRAGGGGPDPGPVALAGGAPDHPAAGAAHRAAAARQRVHRHDQGHLAAVDPVGARRHPANARVPVRQLPAVRPVQHGGGAVRGDHARLLQPPALDRAPLRATACLTGGVPVDDDDQEGD